VFTPYVLIPVLAAIISASLLVYTRRYAALAVTRYFTVIAVIGLALSLLGVVDICLTDVGEKYLLLQLKFLFTPFLCVSVFCMLATHSGRLSWLSLPLIALLSVIPVISVLLALTAQWHDLFFFDPALRGTGPFTLSYQGSLLYDLYIYYSNALLLVSVILLIDSVRRGDRLYRIQGLIILLAFIPPFTVDILDSMSTHLSMNVDLSPLSIVLSGIIMFWGLFRYRILDVKPVAREEVIDNMSDALVVVGTDDRLIDYNSITAKLLVGREGKAIGSPLSEVLPFGKQLEDMISRGETKGDITTNGEMVTSYEASIVPVSVQGQDLARIIMLRDITDRKLMEEELRTANARLSILSSITRHDLGNKLTAIEGYTILARETKDRAQLEEYLARLRQVCASANQLIVFAREYEKLGIAAPGWFSIRDLFAHAVAQNSVRDLKIDSNVDGISVYADAMIEKVLYNLVDNSLRHGNGVTTLSLNRLMDGNRLIIEYTDDGVGVPQENKELIFKRGFGSNTGLGLFLTREILAITGIEIAETGVKGARFEIKVPQGRYRIDN
jgi:signal transduction histidine kinase